MEKASQRRTTDLETLVRRANGMLPIGHYGELERLAAETGDGDYVEVGTAHGAGAIALAIGAAEAGHRGRIYAIDPLGGALSSRSRYGSVEDNRRIVEGNLEYAGVADRVTLFVGTSDEFVARGLCPDRIALLMLDADGHIDRDLGYFYDKMEPEAPIVIDDAKDKVSLQRLPDGRQVIGLKHRLTSLLLAAFMEAGYLELERMLQATAFCRRGTKPLDPEEMGRIALSCYRNLSFVVVEGEPWDDLCSFLGRRKEIRKALGIRRDKAPSSTTIGRLLERARRLRP